MDKIKIRIERGYPITFIGKYTIGSSKQGDGKWYPTIEIFGHSLFGKDEHITFHAPLCSWEIL